MYYVFVLLFLYTASAITIFRRGVCETNLSYNNNNSTRAMHIVCMDLVENVSLHVERWILEVK